MERFIHGILLASSPPLDVAQGGFRAQRSALNQALCLAQICHIYLGIPFKTGGDIERDRLLQHNTQKMPTSLNVMASLSQ
ncbi:hypothetical protein [Absidia glauca]|uniref:Uncharacterized protein n=1 Tax=Absidia glauca TaxID=4829 RepID=A0A163JJN0_ABSGL|nr:hypothetical protein [Absidia glauca]